ncbi:hypothetical protein MM239_15980 [Belliella sp. DSM 111904]|uniref:Uncharacterized protein n=1 Tax=Belliella filtrata TaxID=2923435 RepID=A0ABS9V3F1_9BACT|nr:hypothetical protein [Belliella filtrata]MCH7410908.1 hypothetical protein [Belliella filtrata]
MFDKNVAGLKKKVEKPRLFFYSIFLPVMGLCIYIILKTPSTGRFLNDILLNSLFITLFIVSMVFLDLTWKKGFENRYIPFVRDIVTKRGYEFKSLLDEDSLGSIFDSLIRCGFLEYLDDAIRSADRQRFIRIFKNGNYPEVPIFKMKMDNIQTHYFFDCLKENISGLDLRGYLRIFFHDRMNKQPTEESIRVSKSKATNEPKRKDELNLIFSKLVKFSDK